LTPAKPALANQPLTDGVRGAVLMLWAAAPRGVPQHGNLLLWQGAAREAGVRSLAEYIDANAGEIRRRYLAWSFDLGELRIAGRRLCERFALAGGMSFWWYSPFVEQSTWKQRSLESLLRVFALELLLEREKPAELVFAGADRRLSRVLEDICRRRGIRYRWMRLGGSPVMSARRGLRALPRLVHGLLALGYFTAIRVALGRAPQPQPSAGARRVLICGAFANHNAGESAAGEFNSRFWGTLPAALRRDGYDVQWLHYFYAHDRVPNAQCARRILERINARSRHAAAHRCVESYLPLPALVGIFGRWTAIAAESLLIGWHLRRSFARGEHAIHWPLIGDDWAKAFRGFDCVQNLFHAACFERALAVGAKYDECIYLMENQGWERALARAWHAHGHGRLTGVAHSTVRFWDLRYHCDPRRYQGAWCEGLPGPDCVALNGRAAREAYLATCAPRETILDCEALRYLHLVPGIPRDLRELGRGTALTILVLGDYTRERTQALLQVAQGVRAKAGARIDIRVKPHPGCPLDAAAASAAGLTVADDPVAALVSSAHLVLASNTTSAALEAYVCGGRLLVLDDCSGVNYSPLRGVPGVAFVRDVQAVCGVIGSLDPDAREPARQVDAFFNIDADLPRWRHYFDPRQRPAGALGRATAASGLRSGEGRDGR
jgi:surface carbohydrate biosynthesis protein (TIGR04326 family)